VNVARARALIANEFEAFHPILAANRLVANLIPAYSGYRARTAVLRMGGWRIHRSAFLASVPSWSGPGRMQSRLSIGADCWINVGCRFDLSDEITLEQGVAIGHDVLILTSTHRLGDHLRRAAELTVAPVTIERGAWIGARAVILPGLRIGAGAVVAAGAVVTQDVAPDVMVGGVPARELRAL
jgi:maltose O-acetyltransferase